MTLITFSHTIEAVIQMFQHRSSEIRQKGESQNRENKKTKNFPKNEHFLNVCFPENLACFALLLFVF